MARELFVDKNFQAKSMLIIQRARDVLDKYQAKGMTLTLRQLYYQFVGHDLFLDKYVRKGGKWVKLTDEMKAAGVVGTINAEPNYDMLGNLISDARLAGLIDWDAIEDRTRFLRGHTVFGNPSECISRAAERYRIDLWKGQPIRLEVWIEKDALIGVVSDVCSRYDINYFACKGYASQTELYNAGKRIAWRRQHHDQDTLVLHLGDHDPSGMDMTRDNQDRLSLFAGDFVDVKRIALNMPQVERYDPPPNPAKLTDCRAGNYIAEFGDLSWELDALEPEVIAALIDDEVQLLLDSGDDEPSRRDMWEERQAQFDKDKETLQKSVEFAAKL